VGKGGCGKLGFGVRVELQEHKGDEGGRRCCVKGRKKVRVRFGEFREFGSRGWDKKAE